MTIECLKCQRFSVLYTLPAPYPKAALKTSETIFSAKLPLPSFVSEKTLAVAEIPLAATFPYATFTFLLFYT